MNKFKDILSILSTISIISIDVILTVLAIVINVSIGLAVTGGFLAALAAIVYEILHLIGIF